MPRFERELARLVLDAAHEGDVIGAMGAAQTLALVAGHIEPPGSSGGTNVNVNLAAMVQRLDAEEHARELALEDQRLIERDPAAEMILRGDRLPR